ncbi:MAG: PGF-CTERM protein [Natronomonas sp.]|jgi:PGF-CTERM protein
MNTENSTNGRSRALAASIVVAALAVTLLAAVAAAPAAANHGSDAGNYTVVLPHDSDHLPGDQNEANASIQNFSQAGERFEQEGAPEGFETLEYLEVRNEAMDWSNCDSPNTAVFGIDRGNNNSGTKTDTDLLQHMKNSNFHEDGIEVIFYEESDLGGDPTYINPEDAIISVQGAGSSDGPCFTMPKEPGWYQIHGMIEGTTYDGETVQVEANSHYFPICEGCHDNETAYEKLGPPPSQQTSGGDSTPTPTPTATATPTPTPDDGGDSGSDGGDSTPTPTPTATPTPTPDDGGDSGSDGGGSDGGDDSNDGASSNDDGAAGSNDDGIDGTPTPGDGPGFGAIAALAALLGSTLLARRRG